MHEFELHTILMQFFCLIFVVKRRWNKDENVDGPFPVRYSKIERTLRNLRKTRYERSPTNCEEIITAFQNQSIMDDLGTSLHRSGGMIYNYTHTQKEFSYCILSSPRSIELITSELDPKDMLYLIDGTFRITPMCKVFKQVLIIHAQFGIKVSLRSRVFDGQQFFIHSFLTSD